MRIKIESPVNPYRDNVQGKANEPITVAGLLDRAKQIAGYESPHIKPDWTLEEIYQRLEQNAPRIAIIGGSEDHPAHIVDLDTTARAALSIWRKGGLPFYFSTPVLCDGTAQNNMGMSYSLQSRNAVAEMVVNQMEAHSYHGAFVIQGCDKQPMGVVSALGHLDTLRKRRGEAPVFATFAPAHVLKGGSIPDDLKQELALLAETAIQHGYEEIAEDLRDAMSYILQCSSNTAFQGVFTRSYEKGLITEAKWKDYEQRLAVSTCDAKGGVCAFNGTGNSSRHLVAGLGLVHPAVELLTAPPNQKQIDEVIADLFQLINKEEYSVGHIIGQNISNAIRIHSASGGSTNLVMHLVGAMIYTGYDFSLWDLEEIHRSHPVPDLFNYSLTEGRDIFALAQQCCSGESRGMETLFYELLRNGVPMNVQAPTVAAKTWRERLSNDQQLAADWIKEAEKRIITEQPRRPFSGVDVLQGNFFESAVVKISGMPTPQLNEFDDKYALVLYYENEDAANKSLLNTSLLHQLKEEKVFAHEQLIKLMLKNAPQLAEVNQGFSHLTYEELYDLSISEGALRIAVIIAGQGPAAFGMPEMFTPMQHINANRQLRKFATIISDGRYSGVTYGAAIGHMTPEAMQGGGILYLQSSDLLHLQLRARRIDLLDEEGIDQKRVELGKERLARMKQRRKQVAAANRLTHHTDAAKGVVPLAVYEDVEWSFVHRSET